MGNVLIAPENRLVQPHYHVVIYLAQVLVYILCKKLIFQQKLLYPIEEGLEHLAQTSPLYIVLLEYFLKNHVLFRHLLDEPTNR